MYLGLALLALVAPACSAPATTSQFKEAQITGSVLIVFPGDFAFNEESALSSLFQKKTAEAAVTQEKTMDGFKGVNDNYRHEAGGWVLKEVASRFVTCIRQSDMVARIGGDEFLVVISEFQSIDDIAKIARKLLEAIYRPFILREAQVSVGDSIGISIYQNDSDDIDYLIKQSGTAMCKIKNSGKNSYTFASSKEVNNNIQQDKR